MASSGRPAWTCGSEADEVRRLSVSRSSEIVRGRSATPTHAASAMDDFVTEDHVADLTSCRGGFSNLAKLEVVCSSLVVGSKACPGTSHSAP